MQLAFIDPGIQSEPGEETDSVSQSLRTAIYKGAEYLVLADLSLRGLTCYPVSEGLSYDLVVDLNGNFRRVQVKSTSQPLLRRRGASAKPRFGYIFEGGNDGLSKYASEADVMAFVALDRRMILYMDTALMGRRVVLNPDRFSEDACRLSAESCFPALGAGGIEVARRA